MRAVQITTWVTVDDIIAAVGCARSTAYNLLREARGGDASPGLARVSVETWERYARERFGEAKTAISSSRPAPRAKAAPPPRPGLRLVASNGEGLEVRPTQPRTKRR